MIIKNHQEKISIEFPESVNLEKSYVTKHSLRSEAILESTWMQNGVASLECACKGTGNEFNSNWCKIRRTFFQKFSRNNFH